MGLSNSGSSQPINNLYSFANINPFSSIINQDDSLLFQSPLQSPMSHGTISADFHFLTPSGKGNKRTSNSNGSKTPLSKKSKGHVIVNNNYDTMGYLNDIYKIINRLDNEILILKSTNKDLVQKNLSMSDYQTRLNINMSNLQKENRALNDKLTSLIGSNTKIAHEVDLLKDKSNDVLMNDQVIETPNRLFSDLFERNKNKVSKPLQDIIKVVTDHEDNKRKREKNLLIFGLKVDKNEKHFVTVKKLLYDIGIDEKCVNDAFYLNATNDHAPIKLVTSDSYSKNLILKASRHLKQINIQNNTKISICQDLSMIDRQIHKDLILNRNELNGKLQTNSDHYYGIRNNNVVKIIKKKL